MKLCTGDKLCGFTVQRVRYVDEARMTLYEMTHDKTGAQLCWADSGEENKLFSVSFKTIPENSTGVFHILEHSVLCGSEKYPVREPFVELLKSSMNTFLNAMTYPDKTMYPVSSRNERDFLNLTSVYLDAVFAPRLLCDPNIFRQEGWHIELSDEGNSYNGVVFNEMKGAMSGVDGRLEYAMNELVFPDSCYRFNSGGDPVSIPELSYEQFCDTYRRFYHPSNARFFLDGDIPLEKTLGMIDGYLSRFERQTDAHDIPMQKPVSAQAVRYFETDEEDNSRRAVLSLGKIIGTWEDKTKTYAAQILCDYLADTNESPLKKAVLSSGLAEDLELNVSDGTAQSYIMVTARNLSDADSDKVKKLIFDTVRGLLDEGLSADMLSASINQYSFASRQMPEPKGLYRAAASMAAWLYGGDPLTYIVCDDTFAELRDMAANGEFDRLLDEIFGDDGWSVLRMLPSASLGAQEAQAESDRLDAYLSSCTQSDTDGLHAAQESLIAWQQTPDAPELLAMLPTLPLSEVEDTPELIPTQVSRIGDTTVLYHDIPTNGIVYLSLYFPLTRYSLRDVTQASFLAGLYGELPTENYDTAALQLAIKTYIGKLRFSVSCSARDDCPDECTPRLVVKASVLKENIGKAYEIIVEILTKTRIDKKESVYDIVRQLEDAGRQTAILSGHVLAVHAVRAQYRACDAVTEAISGNTAIRYLHELAENFDSMFGGLTGLFEDMRSRAISKTGLTVAITATENVDISPLLELLPEGEPSPATCRYTTGLPLRSGIKIPAPISFAVRGYDISRCGMDYDGSLRVAANILSLSCLWNKVRVQGGAYGAGMIADRIGGIVCYSYRDPSPEKSLDAYDSMAQFLREFIENGEEELDKFIISAVAATDPLRTPSELGSTANDFYFSGVTDESRIRMRRQMLATDERSLLRWCDALDAMAKDGAVCVVGNEDSLGRCDDLTIIE